MSALFLLVYKILAQSKKSRKVNAITAIFCKIRNTLFKSISAKFKNQTTSTLYTILKSYLSHNLNFSELWKNSPFFRVIENFIKSERFDEFFPNLIANLLEHWSLYKELFSSIAWNLRQLERSQKFFKKLKSS